MSKIVATSLAFLILSSFALAQSTDVPPSLKPPGAERVVVQTHAIGVQIYTCSVGADGKFAWTLKGPQAELRDDNGRMIISHSAGPKWQHNDGSTVTGKMVAKENAPAANSVPWLLLAADNSRSTPGMLTDVNYVQRIHTDGGQPPADGCDEAHKGSETKSKYTADYVFFAPAH